MNPVVAQRVPIYRENQLLNGISISKHVKEMEAYKLSKIYFDQDNLVLVHNNQQYFFKINEISDKLAKASAKERNNFKISPSGYGIHWPSIDEDLSINGLLNRLKKSHVA
jgi:hypothetical protein